MATYSEIRQQVESLSAEEQLRLLEELAALVRHRVISDQKTSNIEVKKKGLDRWFGFLPKRVDALEFQLEIRKEWDE